MRLTLRHLQIFRAIAISGSTTSAASSVALSQSATSAALNSLERILGAQLFDRVGKRLVLNDSGRTLLPNALAILDGAQGVESAFLAKKRGVQVDLQLYASTTIGNYVLPRLLSRFCENVPGTRLQLRIGNTLDVVNAVRDFAADVGLIEGPCHSSDTIVTPWLEDELVIVAAPNHPLAAAAKRGRLSPSQLAEAQWLLREPGSGTREAVEYALLPYLQHFRNVMVLGSSEVIKNSAAEGLGISCLSRCVVHDLVTAKRLTVLATTLPPLTRRFALIYHQTKMLSASLRNFITYCQSHDNSDLLPKSTRAMGRG
jgi:DNA-binding transcriptional LysR family regulator